MSQQWRGEVACRTLPVTGCVKGWGSRQRSCLEQGALLSFLRRGRSKIKRPAQAQASQGEPPGPQWSSCGPVSVSPWRCARCQSMLPASSSLTRPSGRRSPLLSHAPPAAALLHATQYLFSPSPQLRCPLPACACPNLPLRSADNHPGHRSRHALSASPSLDALSHAHHRR